MINLYDHLKDLVRKDKDQLNDRSSLNPKKRKSSNKKKIILNGMPGDDASSMNSRETSQLVMGFGKKKEGDDKSNYDGD